MLARIVNFILRRKRRLFIVPEKCKHKKMVEFFISDPDSKSELKTGTQVKAKIGGYQCTNCSFTFYLPLTKEVHYDLANFIINKIKTKKCEHTKMMLQSFITDSNGNAKIGRYICLNCSIILQIPVENK